MAFNYALQWESPRLKYYWHHNFVHEVYRKHLVEKITGQQERKILVDCRENFYSFYLDIKEIEEIGYKYISFFLNEKKFINWLNKCQEENINACEEPWLIPSSYEKQELFSLLKGLEKKFHYSVALHLVSQPHITSFLEHELRVLMKHIDSQLSGELLSEVTLPLKLPEILFEQFEWYTLLLLVERKNLSEKKRIVLFQQHLDKWRFITAGDSRKPMTLEYLIKRSGLDMGDYTQIKKQYTHLLEIKDGSFARRVAYLENKYLSKESQRFAFIIREISYIRFITKSTWMKLWFLIDQVIKRLENILEMPLEDFTSSEMEDINNLTENLIWNDRKTYLYISGDEGPLLYYNGTDKMIRSQIFEEIDFGSIEYLQGSIGYKGTVHGRVVCIGWNDDVTKKLAMVTEDTILVVPQTTPAYVGALVKVRGLVVDEAGITGHASIISRELRLPSIIGTRIATKVFHDGDNIIIDGDKCIVKKIIEETKNE